MSVTYGYLTSIPCCAHLRISTIASARRLKNGVNTKDQDKAPDKVDNYHCNELTTNQNASLRDLDQIHADLRSPKQLAQHKTAKPAEDLPGLGRFYCVECAKWFEGEHSLVQHRRGKNHKRRFHTPSLSNILHTYCAHLLID